jgi:hypothetical protein
VDPDSLNPDPDTDPDTDPHLAFQVNPDPGFFDDQKRKKKNTVENFFYTFFDQKFQFIPRPT